MTASRLAAVGVLAAAIVITTCGDPHEPQGGGPGWVNIVLSTANTDDGGIAFTVQGPVVDSVRGTFANTFIQRANATEVRVILIGPARNGAIIGQVLVVDTTDVSGYSATVTEAAAGTPLYIQRSPSDYSLTVGSAP